MSGATTIEVLERKVRSLRDQLGAAEESLRKARLAEAPMKVGDLIDLREHWKGDAPWRGPYRVARVFVKYGRVDFTYNERKKDGDWSKRERTHYSDEWRLHTPSTEPSR